MTMSWEPDSNPPAAAQAEETAVRCSGQQAKMSLQGEDEEIQEPQRPPWDSLRGAKNDPGKGAQEVGRGDKDDLQSTTQPHGNEQELHMRAAGEFSIELIAQRSCLKGSIGQGSRRRRSALERGPSCLQPPLPAPDERRGTSRGRPFQEAQDTS
ncbi:UNVERIFIED_CONTAM: hypothetical protein K2H54_041834 [Gekko kuhli]